MLVETAMGLAAPWPLKIVLDSVFADGPMPRAFAWLAGDPSSSLTRLNVAVVSTIVIALLQAGSAYLNAYYTVSIGQWIAHDLRQSIYAHLQRLSMSYYDKQQVGPLISTITDDINAVQDFVSTSLLDILIDGLTIVGMLVVMFTLNWHFTIVALAVTPLLAVFAIRLRGVVKQATRNVRLRQSEIVSIVQEGLGSIRVVKAFARGAFERERLDRKSVESVEAALYARRVRSLLGPVVTGLVAFGTAAVLWFGARLVLAGAMTAGALVIFMAYLGKLFQPIQDLAKASTNIAQASVGLERIRAVLDADERLPRSPQARALDRVSGRVEFRHVRFELRPRSPRARPTCPSSPNRVSSSAWSAPAAAASRRSSTPHPALLRSGRRHGRHRRRRRPRVHDAIAAAADRVRAPGHTAVLCAGLAEHCLWSAGRDARCHRARGHAGAGGRVHQGIA